MKIYRVHNADDSEAYEDVEAFDEMSAVKKAAEIMFEATSGEIGTLFNVVCNKTSYEITVRFTPYAIAKKHKSDDQPAVLWKTY